MNRICNHCRFWQAWPDKDQKRENETYGDCRRKSPSLVQHSNGQYYTKWPSTSHTAGCGKFKALKVEEEYGE